MGKVIMITCIMLAKLTLFCDFSSSKQHFLQIQEQLLHFCNLPSRLIPYLCKTKFISNIQNVTSDVYVDNGIKHVASIKIEDIAE